MSSGRHGSSRNGRWLVILGVTVAAACSSVDDAGQTRPDQPGAGGEGEGGGGGLGETVDGGEQSNAGESGEPLSGNTGGGGQTNGAGGGGGAELAGAGGAAGAGEWPKEPLLGLIDMQSIGWHNTDAGVPSFIMTHVEKFPGKFGGIVINAAWNQLEATQGDFDFSSIDDALEQVRSYNEQNAAAPLGVKLRVYAGSTSPDWAKEINGGPVQLYRNKAGCTTLPDTPCPIKVGKYWTTEYIAAWRALQVELAARYDAEPLIRQVAVTSCAPQTDEPFVPNMEASARDVLKAPGSTYSDEAEQACLLGAIDDYAPWQRTLIDYTFNPFNHIEGGSDTEVTKAVMKACRDKLGSRCVLSNHALAWPMDINLAPVYSAIKELGPPINFQTMAPRPSACQWTGTIALGVDRGAGAIEVWTAAGLEGTDALSADNIDTLVGQFTTPIEVPTGDPVGDCPGFH